MRGSEGAGASQSPPLHHARTPGACGCADQVDLDENGAISLSEWRAAWERNPDIATVLDGGILFGPFAKSSG